MKCCLSEKINLILNWCTTPLKTVQLGCFSLPWHHFILDIKAILTNWWTAKRCLQSSTRWQSCRNLRPQTGFTRGENQAETVDQRGGEIWRLHTHTVTQTHAEHSCTHSRPQRWTVWQTDTLKSFSHTQTNAHTHGHTAYKGTRCGACLHTQSSI